MTENISFEDKKLNPAGAYGHPDEVLSDQSLTRDQRIEILREWHYDALRLQDSAAENMTGGEPDRLQSVTNALLKLGVSPAAEADPHAPEKDSVLGKGLASIGRYVSQLAHALCSNPGGFDRE